MRLVPWNVSIDTITGPEIFERGAFEGTDPAKVRLMGPEHEALIGVGQDGKPAMKRRPTGRAIALDDREDGQYATFRVARTVAGDEQLALAVDGIVDGVSIEFKPRPPGPRTELRQGRRTRVYGRATATLTGTSTTYTPAFEDAAVVAVRTADVGETEDMGVVKSKTDDESVEVPTIIQSTESVDLEPVQVRGSLGDALSRLESTVQDGFAGFAKTFGERIGSLEEQTRSAFVVPGAPITPDMHKGEWMNLAIRALAGERISDTEFRVVADLVTDDNVGVVPPTYMSELIGVIDNQRPFMESTRRLPTPETGMNMIVPKIVTRPSTGVQADEKDELASSPTSIQTETFGAETIGGVGDLSIQLLRRSSPSYLDLFLELLGEQYAMDAEDRALRHLFDEIGGGVGGAEAMDPADLELGGAFQTSFGAIRRPPDTIWLSTEAVAEFIDAKATGTNAPLYPGVQASATAAGGISGTISGLRAVHVPGLDSHGAFAVVGPSRGFAWAEDGTFTLQVDVPSKAGRDVALVGIIWFAPWYPAAFTAYNVAS